MTGFTAKCPSGCGRSIRRGHLMCGPCWREVPKHLQLDVHRTWRSFQRDGSDTNWAAYKAAREAALGAIA